MKYLLKHLLQAELIPQLLQELTGLGLAALGSMCFQQFWCPKCLAHLWNDLMAHLTVLTYMCFWWWTEFSHHLQLRDSRGSQSCLWIFFYSKQYNLLQRTQHILELKEKQIIIYALSLEEGHHASWEKLSNIPLWFFLQCSHSGLWRCYLWDHLLLWLALIKKPLMAAPSWVAGVKAHQLSKALLCHMPSGGTEGRLLPLMCWARAPGLQTPVLCAVVIPEKRWSSGILRKNENAAREY